MRRRPFLLGLVALLGSTLVAGAGPGRDPADDATVAVPYRARYVFYAD